jgi:RNA polymerase sigma-70 factor, ECF subfamily
MQARAALVSESEQELVRRLKLREEAAFNELVRQHQDRVYRLCLRFLHNASEAEDVAQEVFVSVFKAIENFREDSQLSTWMFRIAVNHAKNRLKYLARRATESQKVLDDEAGDATMLNAARHDDRPDRVVEGLQSESLIVRAMAMLDDDQRELVTLRDLENLSYEELQEITGLPAGTVKSRLHRARLALQQHYEALSEGHTR